MLLKGAIMPFKDRIEQMKEDAKFKKIRTHIEKNKNTYMGVAGGFIIGGVVFHHTPQVKSVVDAYKLQINSPTTNAVSVIAANRQGPPSWVTRNKTTGDTRQSQRAMARHDGVSETDLSKHLNGQRDNVSGMEYERICLAA
jgi:hypothetical protein